MLIWRTEACGAVRSKLLQIASKNQPSLVERYQIFCTVENSKRLKDAQEGQGLDLQAYVEFKRNYR